MHSPCRLIKFRDDTFCYFAELFTYQQTGMKTIILAKEGGAENFEIADKALPEAGSGEVRIRVVAISINPVDIKTRKGGALFGSLKEQAPVILGWDVSGVVDAVGPDVADFRIGDEVFGMVNFPGHGKAYAECVIAPAAHLTKKPENISHEEAAAATLAALTAWQVLIQQGGLKSGQRVLIHAAAGGVGHYAVQIAKHIGATVVGTASRANESFLRELGVDEYIDYHQKDALAAIAPVDLVLDPIGGETTVASVDVLKDGGTLVSIVGGVKDNLQERFAAKNITAKNYLVQSSGSDMSELAKLMREGKLKSVVSHRFPFEQMAEAHAQIETGRTRGKVVLTFE